MGISAFVWAEFAMPAFTGPAQVAVDAGLATVVMLDAKGKVLAVAGELDDDEARAMAAHTTHYLRGAPAFLARMLDGEMIRAPFGDRDIRIGIVSNCVLFLVVLPHDPETVSPRAVAELRSDIALVVHRANTRFGPLATRSGGSSSAPAELPAVDHRITSK